MPTIEPRDLFVAFQTRAWEQYCLTASALWDQVKGRQEIPFEHERYFNRCFAEATEHSELAYIQQLIGLGLSPPSRAISAAAQYGKIDILQCMLQARLDPKTLDDALSWGALGGQLEAVRLICSTKQYRPSDISIQVMAVRGGNMALLDYLMDGKEVPADKRLEFFTAACQGSVEMVKRFERWGTQHLKKGLGAAGKKGNGAVVAMLASKPQFQGKQGDIFVQFCSAYPWPESAMALIGYANERQKGQGLTAAVMKGSVELTQALLDHMTPSIIEQSFLACLDKGNPAAVCALVPHVNLDNQATRDKVIRAAVKSGDQQLVEQMFELIPWNSINHKLLIRQCKKYAGFPYLERQLLMESARQPLSKRGASVVKRKRKM